MEDSNWMKRIGTMLMGIEIDNYGKKELYFLNPRNEYDEYYYCKWLMDSELSDVNKRRAYYNKPLLRRLACIGVGTYKPVYSLQERIDVEHRIFSKIENRPDINKVLSNMLIRI